MGAAGVMDEIERIAVEVALSIMAGKGFSFRVPTRSSGNQKYVEELDRIVLGDKVRRARSAAGGIRSGAFCSSECSCRALLCLERYRQRS